MNLKLNNKFNRVIFAGVIVGGIAACSTGQSYESYKQTAINNCASQPSGSAYNDCVERAKMSAEEYRIDLAKKRPPQ